MLSFDDEEEKELGKQSPPIVKKRLAIETTNLGIQFRPKEVEKIKSRPKSNFFSSTHQLKRVYDKESFRDILEDKYSTNFSGHSTSKNEDDELIITNQNQNQTLLMDNVNVSLSSDYEMTDKVNYTPEPLTKVPTELEIKNAIQKRRKLQEQQREKAIAKKVIGGLSSSIRTSETSGVSDDMISLAPYGGGTSSRKRKVHQSNEDEDLGDEGFKKNKGHKVRLMDDDDEDDEDAERESADQSPRMN